MPASTEPTHGSSARRRLNPDPSPEDALADPGPSTDDTPTIISRNTPASSGDPRTIRGRRLAHFELIEPIGVGGMAAVLRARDTQLDRPVALKVLPPEMALDPENVKRFHQEARSAAKLDHENIARVYFCGEDQRLHFIAFEFVEGENLRAVIERRGRLPVAEALHYMIQVAAGLAHAAERGVVHRDIKPSNIIITPCGRAKLVDMGLARSLARKGEEDLTQSGVTLGTFDYISPEQALEPRDADTRSDIYSLGCTFYHALTGKPPVPEGTAAKKLHHHQHVKPTDPRDLVPGLPAEVVLALDRMMSKRPEDRFQTPEHLMQALLAAAKRLGVADLPDGLAVEATLPPRQGGGGLLAWAALAAALVIGIVLLSEGGTPGARAPSRPRPDQGAPPAPGAKDTSSRKDDEKPPTRPKEDQKPAILVVTSETRPADLARDLAALTQAPRVEVLLEDDLDLSSLPEGGLTIKARSEVLLRTRPGRGAKTLSMTYLGGEYKGTPLTAVTLVAPRVVVEDVRFVIDAALADIRIRALRLPQGTATISRCTFVQAMPPTTPHAMESVHAAGLELTLKDCAFLGFSRQKPALQGPDSGQDAVALDAPVRLTAEQCVFGPHQAAVRVESGGDRAAVTMKGCSVMLPPRRSAAFDLDGEAGVSFDLSHCLFARLPGDGGDAVLLRHPGPAEVKWKASDCACHDLDGFWPRGEDDKKRRWTDFRRQVVELKLKDDTRLVLCSPWAEAPKAQRESLESERLEKAFALKLNQRALRGTEGLVGASSVLGTRWAPEELPEPQDDNGRRTLVVEEGSSGEERNGVFGALDAAIRAAKSGDVVVIRHEGELKAEPVTLSKLSMANLTIRPARRWRPVLKLAEAGEADAALFKLHDGRLRLEGLEVRLEAGGGSQAVACLLGDGECVMSGCVLTLTRAEDARGTASVATLPSTAGIMRMGVPPVRDKDQGPRLLLDACLVRGDGDLVIGKASRPASIELSGTLAALTGSVLAVELEGGETPPPAAQRLALQVRSSTLYLGAPLARVKVARGLRAAVPTECEVSRSVILPASPRLNILSLDAPEGEAREDREKCLKWKGSQNAYGKYSSLTSQPAGEEMMIMSADQWKRASGDDLGVFGTQPARAPMAESLHRMQPDDLELPRELEAGARKADLPNPRP
jgi:predicted Ser/Thr protein kinase